MNKKIIFVFFLIILSLFFIFNYKNIFWTYLFLEANKKYNNSNYSWALDSYNNAQKFLSWANLDYNLWNTYYKLWEKEKSLDNKISNYKKSLEFYSKNLVVNKDDDLNYNYQFVKNKLDAIEKEKQEEENKEKEKEKEKEKSNDKDKETWEKQEDKNWKNNNTYIKLSIQDINQIDNYIYNLKQEEKYNRQFFNTFNNLQNKPIFDNVIDWGEKDW